MPLLVDTHQLDWAGQPAPRHRRIQDGQLRGTLVKDDRAAGQTLAGQQFGKSQAEAVRAGRKVGHVGPGEQMVVVHHQEGEAQVGEGGGHGLQGGPGVEEDEG